MLMEFGLNAHTVWAVCLIEMTLKTLNQTDYNRNTTKRT